MLLINENRLTSLRKTNKYVEPVLHNRYGELSFTFFFSKFLNTLYGDDPPCSLAVFKAHLIANCDFLFGKFIKHFTKFDLDYKINTFR